MREVPSLGNGKRGTDSYVRSGAEVDHQSTDFLWVDSRERSIDQGKRGAAPLNLFAGFGESSRLAVFEQGDGSGASVGCEIKGENFHESFAHCR